MRITSITPEPRPRLIATDLDGTLLGDDLRASPRTVAALRSAEAAGVPVVPVTARQPIGLLPLTRSMEWEGWALCGNGSLAIHTGTGERLFESVLDVAIQAELAGVIAERLPGVLFASVRDGGDVFVAQHGYSAIASESDHKRDPATMGAHPLEEVLAVAGLKLIVRHPETAPETVLATIRGWGLTGFEATCSGAPFVEITGAGVSKATGLARLCAHLGVEPAEVVAFGDALNDVEMLTWAGHGVAVANACAETLAVADEVTGTNAEDGVAQVLERLLGMP